MQRSEDAVPFCAGAFAPSLQGPNLVVGKSYGVVQGMLQLHAGHTAPVLRGGIHVAQNVVAQVVAYKGCSIGNGLEGQLLPGKSCLHPRRPCRLGSKPAHSDPG